jgi:hypothetical protein
MKAKEQLLQELESTPDCLIEETLDFLRFIKIRERSNFSTGKSLLEHLQNIGTWQRDDFDECYRQI